METIQFLIEFTKDFLLIYLFVYHLTTRKLFKEIVEIIGDLAYLTKNIKK